MSHDHVLTPARIIELVTPAQMREMDRRTIEEVGIPGVVLMERASLGAAATYEAHFDAARPVVFLCGGGNNGGDGYAVARMLHHRGHDVMVVALSDPTRLGHDARINHDACARVGVDVLHGFDLEDDELRALLSEHGTHDTVWCDAMLGTGLDRHVTGRYLAAIEYISGRDVFALDVPSGLDAHTGRVLGACASARVTATFGRVKVGQTLDPGRAHCGLLVPIEIGLPDDVARRVGHRATWLCPQWATARLAPRPLDAHKGSVGKVLCVAGSERYVGAALLCARAASETGAGLVTLATHTRAAAQITLSTPEVMPLDVLSEGTSLDALVDALARASVVACGPGLGRSGHAKDALERVLSHSTSPTVLDADALNLIAEHDELRALARALARSAGVVITPHPGEASRLLRSSIDAVTRDPIDAATSLASALGCVVVLKGGASVVAAPDGRVAINGSGNPGMASGGMGDVLTGVVAARLGECDDLYEATCVAVHAHGLAGDLAREARGVRGVSASAVIEHAPRALSTMEAR